MALGPLSRSVQQALAALPRALRQDLSGYTNAVADAMSTIASDAGIRLTPTLSDQFLAMATIRRLWLVVEGQHWLMFDSLDLLSTPASGAAGYRIGQTTLSRSSETFADARDLLDDMEIWLKERDLLSLVTTSDLRGLLDELAGTHG